MSGNGRAVFVISNVFLSFSFKKHTKGGSRTSLKGWGDVALWDSCD